MPAATKRPKAGTPKQRTKEAVDWLERNGSKAVRDGMARFNIPAGNAFGVSMGKIHGLAKKLGKDHELSLGLWETGQYEARLLAAYVGEPERVTPAQMDAWCKAFDSWAVVDTVCFALFGRSPQAWPRVKKWATRKGEFEKRAAYALMASLVLRDRESGDKPFLDGLRMIEKAAQDERNFVKKGVNWALRCIGKRNLALNAAAVATAKRLAESPDAAPRWVGKDALRDITKPALIKRLKAKEGKAK
jgi:3-methyladenine DNA glycosylase AlkD